MPPCSCNKFNNDSRDNPITFAKPHRNSKKNEIELSLEAQPQLRKRGDFIATGKRARNFRRSCRPAQLAQNLPTARFLDSDRGCSCRHSALDPHSSQRISRWSNRGVSNYCFLKLHHDQRCLGCLEETILLRCGQLHRLRTLQSSSWRNCVSSFHSGSHYLCFLRRSLWLCVLLVCLLHLQHHRLDQNGEKETRKR